jgi:NADPH:quinone reductase-like Zn-dependent oxidoreductase
MKAAVLNKLGVSPVYQDFADPIPQNDEQILINVKAASVKNIDKLRAGGKHPASHRELPAIVGLDGVGVLENGKRVYAQGITGMIAEKALIANHRFTVLPDNIDNVVAAALPNAAIGAAMAILFRGKMQKGNTILINGATGVTGRVAVQVAKHYGASKIIVTGRKADSLEKLIQLGADKVVSLKQDDESIIKEIKDINNESPIDIVIDYLWGHPIELIIKSLLGTGVNTFNHPVRIVSVGDMADGNINLSSAILRSSAIEIVGSGLGSFSQNDMKAFSSQLLPELFQLAADKKLIIETQVEKLADIETVWNKDIDTGKRLVISMD